MIDNLFFYIAKISTDTHINNIVLSGDTEDLNSAIIDSSDPSPNTNRRLSIKP